MGRGLLAAALKAKGLWGGEGCFELSVGNPDKGLMLLEEAKRRVAQFVKAGLPLVVTQVRCSIQYSLFINPPVHRLPSDAHLNCEPCAGPNRMQLAGNAERFLLQAPLFTLKSKLFSKSTFVIGYDTAIRLIMPKYYGGEVNMLLEMTAMRGRGCSFLVAGRLDGQAAFKTMDDVELPEHLRDIVRTRSVFHNPKVTECPIDQARLVFASLLCMS